MQEIESINSLQDAENFWKANFGKPDYFSSVEDYTDAEELLKLYNDELTTLENRIKRMDVENLNHYVINKTIALHFIVEAGQSFLEKLNDMIYTNSFEAELERLDVIENQYNNNSYWEE